MLTDFRAGLALLAVLGLASAAKAQAADPIFTAFHEACVTPDAAPDAVNAAANTHGWSASTAAGEGLPGFTVSGKVAKTKKIGEANLVLYSWKGAKGPIMADECRIQASRADFLSLQAAVGASLGFAAAQTTPTKVVFHYAGPGNAPTAITDNSQFDAAAHGAGLYILTLSNDGKGASADLLKLHN